MDSSGRIVPDGLLEGKVVAITGASQGIGRAAALGFARAGALVALGARRGALVEACASEIAEAGGQALGLACDVTNEDSVAAFIGAAVDRFGRLDAAFNNAGIDPNPPALVADETLEQWQNIFAVKATGTFLSMKYEIPALIESGGGAIVNHGSVVGARGLSMFATAGASQASVLGLTQAAAASYAGAGLRVNMLLTGSILTPERAAGAGAGTHEEHNSFCPMGRSGRAEEVAAVAAWLCSDFVSYVTGAAIPVDGGFLAGQ
jgi:NAD(P)-dependent dehydrogenase (short-subunit alcohol dehydrogenase family)